jgi:hypothetical protein
MMTDFKEIRKIKMLAFEDLERRDRKDKKALEKIVNDLAAYLMNGDENLQGAKELS